MTIPGAGGVKARVALLKSPWSNSTEPWSAPPRPGGGKCIAIDPFHTSDWPVYETSIESTSSGPSARLSTWMCSESRCSPPVLSTISVVSPRMVPSAGGSATEIGILTLPFCRITSILPLIPKPSMSTGNWLVSKLKSVLPTPASGSSMRSSPCHSVSETPKPSAMTRTDPVVHSLWLRGSRTILTFASGTILSPLRLTVPSVTLTLANWPVPCRKQPRPPSCETDTAPKLTSWHEDEALVSPPPCRLPAPACLVGVRGPNPTATRFPGSTGEPVLWLATRNPPPSSVAARLSWELSAPGSTTCAGLSAAALPDRSFTPGALPVCETHVASRRPDESWLRRLYRGPSPSVIGAAGPL